MFDGILLIGGSASVGKTTLACALAERLRIVDVVHLDEVRRGHASVLHRLDRIEVWDSEPDVLSKLLLEETSSLHPLLLNLVTGLLERGDGAIVEGEGVEPAALDAFAGDPRVRTVYVIETDAEALRRTFVTRSSAVRFLALTEQRQDAVVEMNCRYGRWLRDEATRRGCVCVMSRPWATLADRVIDAACLRSSL